MKIIYSELSYAKTLELSGLLTLYDKREAIGYSGKFVVGLCRPVLQILTLFQT